jgi:hypothetical protein
MRRAEAVRARFITAPECQQLALIPDGVNGRFRAGMASRGCSIARVQRCSCRCVASESDACAVRNMRREVGDVSRSTWGCPCTAV